MIGFTTEKLLAATKAPYGIIGSGKVSLHFKHYFRQLKIPFIGHKSSSFNQEHLNSCGIVLVLIVDDEIENFIKKNLFFLRDKFLVHFSGSVVTDLALGMHPLMTFGHQLYDLDCYKKIPFIMESSNYLFNQIFPKLPNPSFSIHPRMRALYHSFCVMSGNFTTLLWKKFFNEFEEKFNIPKDVGLPYMKKVFSNLSEDSNRALTGPFERKDILTIRNNLDSLKNDPYKAIYQEFTKIYCPEALEEKKR